MRNRQDGDSYADVPPLVPELDSERTGGAERMSERALWDERLETAREDELRFLITEKLKKQIAYVYEKSPFYRRKLSDAGVEPGDINDLEDLERIPFTTKDEIRQTQEQSPPLGEHMCAPWTDVIRIHASSGTTGRPSFVGLTRHDLSVWNEVSARVLWATGARRGEPAWNANALGFWVGGVGFIHALEHVGAPVLPAGNTEVARAFTVAQAAKARFIITTPSFLSYLTEFARRELNLDPSTLGIKNIALGGEPGAEVSAFREKMEREWNCNIYDVMGAADLAPLIWGECHEKQGMHFFGQGFVIPEIVNQKTGKSSQIKKGLVGVLVYTALDRECVPLIRFRIGDIVEVLDSSPCACGRTSFKIRCIDREDNMLLVQAVNVFPSAIIDVVSTLVPRVTGEAQVLLDKPGPRVDPPVKVRVEHGNEPGDLVELKAKIEKLIREKLIFRADVEFVPPGTLRKGTMKRQIVRKLYLESQSPSTT